jgi:hypothetical protein
MLLLFMYLTFLTSKRFLFVPEEVEGCRDSNSMFSGAAAILILFNSHFV